MSDQECLVTFVVPNGCLKEALALSVEYAIMSSLRDASGSMTVTVRLPLSNLSLFLPSLFSEVPGVVVEGLLPCAVVNKDTLVTFKCSLDDTADYIPSPFFVIGTSECSPTYSYEEIKK